MDDATHNPDAHVGASALPQAELDALTDKLVEKLKTVFDPEIPVDIYELGLIYRVDVSDEKAVVIDMTLTAPGCPVAGDMPGWVQDAVESIPEVTGVTVNLVFDPPWDRTRPSSN
jgi:FeS assembly SUF system protein